MASPNKYRKKLTFQKKERKQVNTIRKVDGQPRPYKHKQNSKRNKENYKNRAEKKQVENEIQKGRRRLTK